MDLFQVVAIALLVYLLIALLVGYLDWRHESKRHPDGDWLSRLVSAGLAGLFWCLYVFALLSLFGMYVLWTIKNSGGSVKLTVGSMKHRLIRLP